MPKQLISLDNPGLQGIITDIDPQDLPNNAFESGQNVRFENKAVNKFLGHSQTFGAVSVAPYWLMPVQVPTNAYWLYAGLEKVYVTDGASHINITRQALGADDNYSANADLSWNGGIVGGVPVLNNGINSPQMWNPPNSSTRLEALTWDATNTWDDVVWKAAAIRTYREYLIALDVTKSGSRNSRLIAWSTSAVPGTIPSTWDKDDLTEDAGEVELAQTNGNVVDCLSLHDINIVYKDDSVWGMAFVGGVNVFRFYQIFGDIGILTTRCVKEFDGKHFVVTAGDVIVHDGTRKESVIEDKRRDELFNSISAANYARTFVAPNYKKYEMWICYPSEGSNLCDKAMIWNWRDNTWSDRALPQAAHIGYGLIDDAGAGGTWDSDTDTWDSDSSVWDAVAFSPTDRDLLMAATQLYKLDDTTQFDGVDFTSNIQRSGLHFDSPDAIKYVDEIWIRATGSGVLTITLGYEMAPGEGITWNGSQTFTVGTDKKVNVPVSGRYIAYKIESTGAANWKIHGISFRVRIAGRR